MRWDTSKQLLCGLCNAKPDSHRHLFFACDFSSKVWDELKNGAKLEDFPADLEECVRELVLTPVTKQFYSILQRLMLAAIVYFLWQERNLRLFQQKQRTWEEICSQIKSIIKLTLQSLTIYASPSTVVESKI